MNEIFKTNLRAALAERNMTQQELARQLDVSNRTVAAWCLGQTLPQPGRLRATARLLGYPPEWFYQQSHQDTVAA